MPDVHSDGGMMTVAGFPAQWSRLELEVSLERDRTLVDLPCEPIALYTLHEPELSIDAAALLREPVVEDPPYWSLPWTGARAIAAVLSHRAMPSGARVLDLGCGLGLSGLVAARCGASVTFGDYLEEPLEFVRATLARLKQSGCDVRRIDFTQHDDDGRRYDVILAADIVYDPKHYEPLAVYLDRHLAAGGVVLLTESLRADASVFLQQMASFGFADRTHALWVLEDGRRERTWLHELTRA